MTKKLKNNNPQHKLTTAERRKGAANAQKTIKQKKLIKDLAEAILNSEAPPKIAKSLRVLGFDDSNMAAMLLGQIQSASKGNSRAFEDILKIIGQMPKEEINIDTPTEIIIERRK